MLLVAKVMDFFQGFPLIPIMVPPIYTSLKKLGSSSLPKPTGSPHFISTTNVSVTTSVNHQQTGDVNNDNSLNDDVNMPIVNSIDRTEHVIRIAEDFEIPDSDPDISLDLHPDPGFNHKKIICFGRTLTKTLPTPSG